KVPSGIAADTIRTRTAARRTYCNNGHRLEGDNVKMHKDGSRRCRICNINWQRRRTDWQGRTGKNWAAAKMFCMHGHLLSEDNTYRDKRGYRSCRVCLKNRHKTQSIRKEV